MQLPAFLTEDTPASANEVWLRLHSDPLFAVGATADLPDTHVHGLLGPGPNQ